MSSKLLAENRSHVGYLVLNAPQRRNAIGLDMWQAIPRLVREFEENTEIRCIVVRGAGTEAFSAGADISEFGGNRASGRSAQAYDEATRVALGSVAACRKPVIAMISGLCYGGGLALAMACDLRRASQSARFCIPAARLGIAYGTDNTATLVERLGPALATEMLLTGRVYTAPEALARGMVHGLHAPEDLVQEVEDLAALIAGNAPLSLAASKLAIRAVTSASAAAQAAAEAAAGACMDSDDYREGRQAFMEKRRPHFKGA